MLYDKIRIVFVLVALNIIIIYYNTLLIGLSQTLGVKIKIKN